MIKGCSRRVVYLKNTDSAMFDEAYFLLSNGQAARTGEKDMIREAERIISETSGAAVTEEIKKRGGRFWFCTGAVCATGLYLLLGSLLLLLGIL